MCTCCFNSIHIIQYNLKLTTFTAYTSSLSTVTRACLECDKCWITLGQIALSTFTRDLDDRTKSACNVTKGEKGQRKCVCVCVYVCVYVCVCVCVCVCV